MSIRRCPREVKSALTDLLGCATPASSGCHVNSCMGSHQCPQQGSLQQGNGLLTICKAGHPSRRCLSACRGACREGHRVPPWPCPVTIRIRRGQLDQVPPPAAVQLMAPCAFWHYWHRHRSRGIQQRLPGQQAIIASPSACRELHPQTQQHAHADCKHSQAV